MAKGWTARSPGEADGLEGTARAALPLRRHHEAAADAPAARPRRHAAFRDRRLRPGRRWRCRRLGKEDMRDFLRMLLMNVADVLDEHLTDDRLQRPARLRRDARQPSRAALADLAARPLLPPDRRDRRRARRADRARSAAWARSSRQSPRAAEKAGVTVRTGAPVGKIIVEKGRAVGVVLDIGEEIPRTYDRVGRQSAHDLPRPRRPARARHRLCPQGRQHQHERRCRQAAPRARPAAAIFRRRARRTIAAGWSSRPRPTMSSAPSTRAKYGEFSPEPVMEITLPSLADPSLAPTAPACFRPTSSTRPMR